ncbi:MAG: CaiB/BaiF CoA transferase family protein [Variibacter sp.]
MDDVSHGEKVLAGVRVLDLTRFLSGPTATLFLAALGAEVIRIDDPVAGDPTADAPPFFGPDGVSLGRRTEDDLGIAYLKRSRGKKAITLNLKAERGKELFFELVKTADVVVENFRVGVTERLGIDYPSLCRINPRLIYCSITGYGSTGPDRSLKAFDLMVQAATGLMSITGEPQGVASKAGSPISDSVAGTFAMSGVLGALFQRERTGRGQWIDVSMADCLLALILDEPLDCFEGLGLPYRQGNRMTRVSPFNTYPAKDGVVAIGIGLRPDLVQLLEEMGRSDLLESEDFMDTSWRIGNNAKVDEVVRSWTQGLTTQEIIDRLNARSVPCSPIRDIHDILAWPHMQAREMLLRLQHPAFPDLKGPVAAAFPLKFSDARTHYETPAPVPRAHNSEVYGAMLGLSDAEIADLAAKGVI